MFRVILYLCFSLFCVTVFLPSDVAGTENPTCDTNPCENEGTCVPNLIIGEFHCLCQEGFGGKTCSVGKPSPPTSIVAEKVPGDYRTIRVTWVQPATTKRSSQPEGYTLEYKMNTKAYKKVTSNIYGTEREYEVDNLDPGAVYRFRLIAINIAGNSRASDPSNEVILPEMAPSSPPRQVTANAKSSTKIRVRWRKPYREDWNGVLLGYRVIYRVGGDVQHVQVEDPEKLFVDLINLQPDTQYTIYIVAFNSAGQSPASLGVVVRTFLKGGKPTPGPGGELCLCQNGARCITINNEYACICTHGFSGPYCENHISEFCVPPCINGNCVLASDNSYQCHCHENFHGMSCEHELTTGCSSNPCLHGGTCTPHIVRKEEFKCTCTDHFTGAYCEERVPGPCEVKDHCQNGGTCIEVNIHVYMCKCKPEFEGYNCERSTHLAQSFSFSSEDSGEDSSDVSSDVDSDVRLCLLECGPNGICMGSPFDREQYCECYPGYTGKNCQILLPPSNPCQLKPCQNGGQCYTSEEIIAVTGPIDTSIPYVCLCRRGFTGYNCENIKPTEHEPLTVSNPCEFNPCKNGGQCHSTLDLQGLTDISSFEILYTCVCPDDYTGEHCELEKIPGEGKCRPNLCKNGGRCVDYTSEDVSYSTPSSDFEWYKCYCPVGVKGTHCEIVIPPVEFSSSASATGPCDSEPCLNGGYCVPTLTEKQSTSFSFSFSVTTDEYSCVCKSGFYGKNCEHIEESEESSSSASSIERDPCKDNPCQNGGRCISGPPFRCSCLRGFTGRYCETPVPSPTPSLDYCSSSPCKNGLCVNKETTYKCYCWPGAEGRDCEILIEPSSSSSSIERDPCESNPCQNGAICISETTYRCACLHGFAGRDCEINLEKSCEINPCENGGSCVLKEVPVWTSFSFSSEPLTFEYECQCPEGFTGNHCEHTPEESSSVSTVVSVCDDHECLNGGTCIPGISPEEELFDYTCLCLSGFSGRFCEHPIYIPCEVNLCPDGGQCVLDLGDLNNFQELDIISGCICPEGYIGYCDDVFDGCEFNECLNGGECVPGSLEPESGLDYRSTIKHDYTCLCPEMFTGVYCQHAIYTPCDLELCPNGGQCIPDPDFTEDNSNNFECTPCPQGYRAICNGVVACPVPEIRNGFAVGLNIEGATLQVECISGYTLVGPESLTCIQGSYGPNIPVCRENCILPLPIANGHVTGSTKHNEYITYGCSNGFSLVGNKMRKCEDGLYEGAVPSCHLNCNEISISNGYTEGDFNHRSRVVFHCDEGFTLDGILSVICTDGSYNSNNWPVCRENCPSVFKNGFIDGSKIHGETVEFFCNVNYTLFGQSTATCLDGSYTEDMPVCKENCIIPTLENGLVTGSVKHDDYIKYVCLDGYSLDGVPFRKCVDGSYEGTHPTCYLDCDVVPFENGIISGDFKHGTKISFTCNAGYTVDGVSDLNCFDGTFDHEIPVCRASCSPDALENGYITGKFNHGDSAQLFCNKGYKLKGLPFTVCVDGNFQPMGECRVDVPTNPCDPPSPCTNGDCVQSDTITGYSCDCYQGYIGEHCEIYQPVGGSSSADPCRPDPCENNGLCSLTHDLTSFICFCPDEYTGEYCEHLHPCVPDPCKNGGKCTIIAGTELDYQCQCPEDFTGKHCDEDNKLDFCAEVNPCGKNGICIPDDVLIYSCQCFEGYDGENCEIEKPIDPCQPSPCGSHGDCSPVPGGYECSCYEGFTGIHCDEVEIIDPCKSTPCGFNGKCYSTGTGEYTCECVKGYSGEHCEIEEPIDPCETSPCGNHGDCFPIPGGFECSCFDGYTGTYCDEALPIDPCNSSPCGFHGDCSPIAGGYECRCFEGYTGHDCDEAIQKSTLSQFNPNEYGITGKFKRWEDGILAIEGFSYNGMTPDVYFMTGTGNIPSTNGEILAYYFNGTFVKKSLGRKYDDEVVLVEEPDWMRITWIAVASPSTSTIYSVAFFPLEGMSSSVGSSSSSSEDPCEPDPCFNDGECSIMIFGFEQASYMCICPDEYLGQHCEFQNPCEPSPCLNDAPCDVIGVPSNSGLLDFECKCPVGFDGKYCNEISHDSTESSSIESNTESSQESNEGSSAESTRLSSDGSRQDSSEGSSQESTPGSSQESSHGSTDKSSAESTTESSKGSTQESSQESTPGSHGSTDKSSAESTTESSKGSTQESSQESTPGSSQESSHGSTDKSSAESTTESSKGSTQESSQESTPGSHGSTDKSSAESTTESSKDSTQESSQESTPISSQEGSHGSTDKSSAESTTESSKGSTQESSQESTPISSQDGSHGSTGKSSAESTTESSKGSTQESSQESTPISSQEGSHGSTDKSSAESTTESSKGSTQESSQESTPISSQDGSHGSTDKSSAESTTESSKGSTQESSQESTATSSQESSHGSIKGSSAESTTESSEGSTKESSQESIPTSSQESTQGSSGGHSQGSTQQSSQESSQENTKMSSEGSSQEVIVDSSQESTDRGSTGSTKGSSAESTTESSEGSTQGSIETSSQESIETSSSESAKVSSEGISQESSQEKIVGSSEESTPASSQESTQGSSGGHSQGSTQQSSHESSQESTKISSEESSQEMIVDSSQESTDRSSARSTKGSSAESSTESSEGSTEESSRESTPASSHEITPPSSQESTTVSSEGHSQGSSQESSSSEGSTQGSSQEKIVDSSQGSTEGSSAESTKVNSEGSTQLSSQESTKESSAESTKGSSVESSHESTAVSLQEGSQESIEKSSQGSIETSSSESGKVSSEGISQESSQEKIVGSSEESTPASSQESTTVSSEGHSHGSSQESSSVRSTQESTQGSSQESSHSHSRSSFFNPCSLEPCEHGGRCFFHVDSATYSCDCLAEYMGDNCEMESPCMESLCANGASCFLSDSGLSSLGYECACMDGFSGYFCEIEESSYPDYSSEDLCASIICLHGGQCLSNAETFICSCTDEYIGDYCETLNPCSSNVCFNGATCTVVYAGKPGKSPVGFECACTEEYEGEFCDIQKGSSRLPEPGSGSSSSSVFDPCLLEPCKHGGTCVPQLDSTFTCLCPVDYYGDYCEVLDPCLSFPCINGASCFISNSEPDIYEFECICIEGFTGRHCDKVIDPCDSQPCLNNGVCTAVDFISYSCFCDAQYLGDNCEIENPCASSPCENGASCNPLLSSQPGSPVTLECICSEGFRGEFCHEVINPCESQPCHNKGKCEASGDLSSYQCHCGVDYLGDNCEIENPCASSPCENGASCNPLLSSQPGSPVTLECICSEGFRGEFCQQVVDPCDSQPCQNNGQCEASEDLSSYQCHCGVDYLGNNCEIENPCASSPCENGASCNPLLSSQPGSPVTLECICSEGFRGEFCQQVVDPCESQPCQNNGQCEASGDLSSYQCHCGLDYLGDNCEIENPCASSPCENGAACNPLLSSQPGTPVTLECICTEGFRGEFCQQVVDPCESQPCQSNGKCEPLGDLSSYQCHCGVDYLGDNCEIENPCASSPCKNGAACNPLLSSQPGTPVTLECICTEGFRGEFCQQVVDPCESQPCQNNGKCEPLGDLSSYQCHCGVDYLGDNCEIENPCASSPCENGAACNPLLSSRPGTPVILECICTEGFKGEFCQQVVDPCEYQPCQNNGQCEASEDLSSYQCHCGVDYLGSNCEIENPCSSSPCENGASCNPLLSSQPGTPVTLECICSEGFRGEFCQQVVDPCESQPCQNNGQCEASGDLSSYQCHCGIEYLGNNCELVNPCEPSPCLNSATCDVIGVNVAGEQLTFECRCLEGFKGRYCGEVVDPCDSQPCQNNGQCNAHDALSYECLCPEAYLGSNCEIENPCASSPCENGAACNPLLSSQPGSSATLECVCTEGFRGEFCQQVVDPCESQPCQNNGQCEASGDLSSYQCNCGVDYLGDNCEIENPCASSPCENGAACNPLLSSQPGTPVTLECICTEGFRGEFCQQVIDPCESQPCQNNGQCEASGDLSSYQCNCGVDYLGDNCEIENPCASSPCENGAACNPLLSSQPGTPVTLECICTEGFRGEFCQQVIDPCESQPCQNNGQCEASGDLSSYQCNCGVDYLGDNCEIENPCASSPCENGASCNPLLSSQPGSPVTLECICTEGFRGEFCQQVIDPCESQPCQNNGQCEASEDLSSYQCSCGVDYLGNNCELVNPCEPSPCLNSATCDVFGVNVAGEQLTFECRCLEGFKGRYCGEVVDPCESQPCQNNGQCDAIDTSNYRCLCPNAYIGTDCEIENPCEPSPCANGGDCNPVIGGGPGQPALFECECKAGFTGELCQDLLGGVDESTSSSSFDNPCSSNPCQNGFCSIDENLNYVCYCHENFEGINCEIPL